MRVHVAYKIAGKGDPILLFNGGSDNRHVDALKIEKSGHSWIFSGFIYSPTA